MGRYKVNVNSVAFGLIMTRLTEAAADADASIDIAGQQIKVGVNPQVLKNAEALIPLGAGARRRRRPARSTCSASRSPTTSAAVLVCGGGRP